MRLTGKIAQTYGKWSVLCTLGCCGPPPQEFGQVQAKIILSLKKNCECIRKVACPMVFMLHCDGARHWGWLKFIRNAQFSVFLAALVFFSNFLGRSISGLY